MKALIRHILGQNQYRRDEPEVANQAMYVVAVVVVAVVVVSTIIKEIMP